MKVGTIEHGGSARLCLRAQDSLWNVVRLVGAVHTLVGVGNVQEEVLLVMFLI